MLTTIVWCHNTGRASSLRLREKLGNDVSTGLGVCITDYFALSMKQRRLDTIKRYNVDDIWLSGAIAVIGQTDQRYGTPDKYVHLRKRMFY